MEKKDVYGIETMKYRLDWTFLPREERERYVLLTQNPDETNK